MAKKYLVKLLRKEKLAKETWLFAFEKPKGYSFTPGQYQTFTLSLQDGKTDWRDMTIASSPHQTELWMVTKIRSQHSEFKIALKELPIGSLVQLEGPGGGFTIRDGKPHIFLAGGIGVNVFHSILMDAADKKLQIPMVLIASFSHKENMLFYDELKQIENERRKVIYMLTQDDWEGETGKISKDLLEKYVSDISDKIYMIAGSQDFVDAIYEMLVGMGIGKENIRIDYFTGY